MSYRRIAVFGGVYSNTWLWRQHGKTQAGYVEPCSGWATGGWPYPDRVYLCFVTPTCKSCVVTMTFFGEG